MWPGAAKPRSLLHACLRDLTVLNGWATGVIMVAVPYGWQSAGQGSVYGSVAVVETEWTEARGVCEFNSAAVTAGQTELAPLHWCVVLALLKSHCTACVWIKSLRFLKRSSYLWGINDSYLICGHFGFNNQCVQHIGVDVWCVCACAYLKLRRRKAAWGCWSDLACVVSFVDFLKQTLKLWQNYGLTGGKWSTTAFT